MWVEFGIEEEWWRASLKRGQNRMVKEMTKTIRQVEMLETKMGQTELKVSALHDMFVSFTKVMEKVMKELAVRMAVNEIVIRVLEEEAGIEVDRDHTEEVVRKIMAASEQGVGFDGLKGFGVGDEKEFVKRMMKGGITDEEDEDDEDHGDFGDGDDQDEDDSCDGKCCEGFRGHGRMVS